MQGKKLSIALIILVISAVFFAVFGVVGIRYLTGLFMLVLPFIILFHKFGLDTDEVIVSGIFTGLVLFPLLVWYFNWVVSSLTATIFVVFGLLLAVAFMVPSRRENI